MSRGVGAVGAVQSLVPEWTTPLLAVLTDVGDPLVALVVLVAAYWVGPRVGLFDRRRGARLLAAGFAALALVALLKAGFGLSRPPARLWRVTVDGFGFPSGHATAATVAYGGVAAVATWRSRRERWALAAVPITLVAASRVVLGVHYLVDVLAGVALGLATLAVVLRVTRASVTAGFALAAALGVGAVVVAGAGSETVTTAVGPAGAAVGWYATGERRTRAGRGTLAAGGAALVAAVVWTLAAAPPLPVVAAINGVVGAAAVALPTQNVSR